MAQATIEGYTSGGGSTLVIGEDCPGAYVAGKLGHWGFSSDKQWGIRLGGR